MRDQIIKLNKDKLKNKIIKLVEDGGLCNELLGYVDKYFIEPEKCNHLFQCNRCGHVQNERGPFDEKPPTKDELCWCNEFSNPHPQHIQPTKALPEKLDENNYKERKPVIRAINNLIDYLAKDR